jgi:hypothetical protein
MKISERSISVLALLFSKSTFNARQNAAVTAGVSPADFQRAADTAATTEDRPGADDFVLNEYLWRGRT